MATPNECHSLFSTERNDSLLGNTICSVGALSYFRREGSWQSKRRPNSSAQLFHRSTTNFWGDAWSNHKYGRHLVSWWRPITLKAVDGVLAMEIGAFKKYFAGFGTAY
jgi:hypothetical protein